MLRPDLGDIVEIAASPDTVEAGFAGRRGTCYGFTTPSVTGVDVIGGDGGDFALSVGFDDGTSGWFHPSLVSFVSVNAGQIAIVGDKRFVRAADGRWIPER
jgi:hypothetical protein